MHSSSPIVSASWLADHINDSDLVLLEVQLGSEATEHLPNALLFDLKQFSDKKSNFPNTLPTEETFEKGVKALGINHESTVIVYDHKGIYSSPRAWFLFKAMGHANVFVLDGGFPKWKNDGNTITKEFKPLSDKGNFSTSLNKTLILSYQGVFDNIQDPTYQIVDARSSGRFAGKELEPRPELKSGKIPNSKNIPFEEVLLDGQLKTKTEPQKIFSDVSSHSLPPVFSCGSGITACIILLAYTHLIPGEYGIYDGSWTEWATLQQLTVND